MIGLALAPSSYGLTLADSLGQAKDYAVLGIGGDVSVSSDFSVYQSATVIDGNVGMGPYNTWGHGIDATINGRLDYDFTDSAPTIAKDGFVRDGMFQKNMNPAVNDAMNASNSFAVLSPTQTFSTLQENQVIVGNGGLNVIRITGLVALKVGLTISGSSNDKFVFQITSGVSGHVLTFSGMTMTLVGGVDSENIVWNLAGKGGDVQITSGAKVFGTFLAPKRSITVDHGDVTGRIIGGGGGQFVNIHSGSHIHPASK